MKTSIPGFYVTGGTLRADAPSYVEREADKELFDGLTQGEFCYVLTARQMGKSSLMVRTAARLRAQGIAVVVLDLTMVGQNLTVEQWYDGLLSLMGPQLGLEEELERFWQVNQRLGALQRWMAALAQVVLPRVSAGESARPLVIFIDEIDTVRSLPFSSDEFFAAIRACYNRRTEEPAFAHLTFCLLGVATPSDLIRDTRRTPFNIGRRIELNDFAEHEAAPLAQGLAQNPQMAKGLLQRVLYWTNGHPYLTQRLCRAVAERGTASGPRDVDELCAKLFLSDHAREQDDNLVFVRERLLNSEVDRATLLDLYSRIRRGRRVDADESNPLVGVTRLSGIARSAGGRLHVRNHIYQDVFDNDWILSNMPDAERRRQRAAFKRGMIGAVVGVVIVASLLSIRVFKASEASPVELTALEGQVEVVRPKAPAAAPLAPTPPAAPAMRFATNSLPPARPREFAAVVASFQGTVEVRKEQREQWELAQAGQILGGGDCLRTKANSGALLQLRDQSCMRIGERSVVRLTSDSKRRSAWEVIKGQLHFFHRGSSNDIEIKTPIGRAVIKG